MSLIRIMPLAGLLLCLGCTDQETPPAAPQSAQREAMMDTRAVIEQVDQETRVVRLRMMDGTEVNVFAGPQVRNLAQLSAGDTVQLSYYESVIAQLAAPDADGSASTSAVTSRAPEGATPAGLVRTTTDVVVEFVAYDPATGLVTFKTPEGATQTVEVDPAMREFAAARRPGERVALRVTNAVAASIVETGS
ncbi:MAG: hypothetical protein AB7I59_16125 [Geminicoccaceae bacterium]